MTQISGRIVAGIGFASAVTAQELVELIDASLAEAGLAPTDLVAIATHRRKLGTAIPLAVAAHFGVPLRLLDDGDLAMEGLAEGAAAAAPAAGDAAKAGDAKAAAPAAGDAKAAAAPAKKEGGKK